MTIITVMMTMTTGMLIILITKMDLRKVKTLIMI